MKKHLDVPFEVKVLDESDQEGVFEGYGAAFGNEDLGRDIIAKELMRMGAVDGLSIGFNGQREG